MAGRKYCDCGRRIVVRFGLGRSRWARASDGEHVLCQRCYRAEQDKARLVAASNGPKIANAYVSPSGDVTAYDEAGNRLPEFCGRLVAVGPLVRAAGYTGPIQDNEEHA